MKPTTFNVLLILLIALTATFANAYPQTYQYKDLKIKYYYENYNHSEIVKALDTIPEEYLDGIPFIRFYNIGSREYDGRHFAGQYSWTFRYINVFQDNDIDTLLHEIAHNCQRLRGDTDGYGTNHTGQFRQCLYDVEKNYYDMILGD